MDLGFSNLIFHLKLLAFVYLDFNSWVLMMMMVDIVVVDDVWFN
jgi:hypothetical protein